MTLTDEPLLAELARLRAENTKLRALVRQELEQESQRIALETGFTPRLAGYKYPLPFMRVGQAFFVSNRKHGGTLRAMVSYWGRKQGKKFTVRADVCDGVKGWRVVRWE